MVLDVGSYLVAFDSMLVDVEALLVDVEPCLVVVGVSFGCRFGACGCRIVVYGF